MFNLQKDRAVVSDPRFEWQTRLCRRRTQKTIGYNEFNSVGINKLVAKLVVWSQLNYQTAALMRKFFHSRRHLTVFVWPFMLHISEYLVQSCLKYGLLTMLVAATLARLDPTWWDIDMVSGFNLLYDLLDTVGILILYLLFIHSWDSTSQ